MILYNYICQYDDFAESLKKDNYMTYKGYQKNDSYSFAIGELKDSPDKASCIISILVMVHRYTTNKLLFKQITKKLVDYYKINPHDIKFLSCDEVSARTFCNKLNKAEAHMDDISFCVNIKEMLTPIISPDTSKYCIADMCHNSFFVSKERALDYADFIYSEDQIFGNYSSESLKNVVRNIYDKPASLNPHVYYINTDSRERALRIIHTVKSGLLDKHRLHSYRDTYISDIHFNEYDDRNSQIPGELFNIFLLCYENSIAIEVPCNNYNANVYTTEDFDSLVKMASTNSTVFFVKICRNKSDYSSMHFLFDGAILDTNVNFSVISDIPNVSPFYTKNPAGNAAVFSSDTATDSVDKSAGQPSDNGNNDDANKIPAYEKLERMVGLENVKTLIKQIINFSKIQKMREINGLPVSPTCKHMIFSGNPGTAKTTVARLLSQIMADEGLIKNNRFIECKKSDMVGMFTGHTASKITGLFEQAEGGILFIDEAYSLAGTDRNTVFDQEAIDSIVQQMENARDDTIVIFAGYPDKMEKFLDKNEGLKSRIGFHLKFEDYSENDMLEILKFMCDERDYRLDDNAIDKCLDIFHQAVQMPDNGNGRFVRNLLEHALLNQANRVIDKCNVNDITNETLSLLIADDFDKVAIDLITGNNNRPSECAPIGFRIS